MQPSLPSVIVVMGVSGSGKTTIAALLAGRLGWAMAEPDDFHPAANVRKMHSGHPLTDEDRAPWLASMAAWIDATRSAGLHGVLGCSALRRAYRTVLIGTRPDVRLVYLEGDRATVRSRQARRPLHYMPPTLVDSQFDTLEPPGPDERPLTVSVAATPLAIVDAIVAAL